MEKQSSLKFQMAESDKHEVKTMLGKAYNMESFVEDFRMRFGLRPKLAEGSKLPTDADDVARLAESVVDLTEFALEQ